jgi:peptidoglycan/LPS O-acetylase OafA/YrhL
VRGLAILLVLLQHGRAPGAGNAGAVGVTLFFVLSGFLITTLLLEENAASGRISLRQFYVRRVRRLAPAFLVSTTVLCALALLVQSGQFMHPIDPVVATAYVSNWYQIVHPTAAAMGVLSGTWSLAVEEQFYLIWPLALILALQSGRRTAIWLVAGGLAASLVARILLISGGASVARIYLGTDMNATPLLAGVLLAFALHNRTQAVRNLPAVTVAGTIGLVAVAHYSPAAWIWTAPIVALASVVVIWSAARGPEQDTSWLTVPALRWLGKRSYAIYLWNSALAIIAFYATMPRLGEALFTVVPALLLADASWRLVERPVTRRGRESARTEGSIPETADSLRARRSGHPAVRAGTSREHVAHRGAVFDEA